MDAETQKLIDEAEQRGAQQERGNVVGWLRKCAADTAAESHNDEDAAEWARAMEFCAVNIEAGVNLED